MSKLTSHKTCTNLGKEPETECCELLLRHTVEVKEGTVFRDLQRKKYIVVNIFSDNGKYVVTYKHWQKHRKRWLYQSDLMNLFLIAFDYGWTIDN